jgi:hypothetical protein
MEEWSIEASMSTGRRKIVARDRFVSCKAAGSSYNLEDLVAHDDRMPVFGIVLTICANFGSLSSLCT